LFIFSLNFIAKVYDYCKIKIVTSHGGPGGGGPCQCHQMTQGESKIGQKSVTYYLNGNVFGLFNSTIINFQMSQIRQCERILPFANIKLEFNLLEIRFRFHENFVFN
jgi:hypothetical protein